jgi:hypothetical protein
MSAAPPSIMRSTFYTRQRQMTRLSPALAKIFCGVSIPSPTPPRTELSESAGNMGRELAARWRKSHRHVPPDANANRIFLLVSGAYSADRLGFPDRRYKSELRKAAAKFTAQQFLGFDPTHGPPQMDDPGRYDQWYSALIVTFFGDGYGIRMGAHYRDVLRWLPRLRPYEGHDEDMEFDIFYAITHVIYTVDRYHERSVSGSLLPAELVFLRRKLNQAMEDEDPEMVGEALDCLKATGFQNDPQVLAGIKFLVASQRADGSWAGDPDDLYTEYHSAWAGIDGLRDYHFHGKVKKLPLHWFWSIQRPHRLCTKKANLITDEHG